MRERHLTPQPQPGLVRDVTQVASAVKLGNEQIIDARAADRFRGEAAEPRPGLKSGHIPGSRNLPVGQLYNENGTMKDTDTLRAPRIGRTVRFTATCGPGWCGTIGRRRMEASRQVSDDDVGVRCAHPNLCGLRKMRKNPRKAG